MAYPKNDTDFVDGFVTFVTDDGGEMIMVGHHMPNWGLPGGYRGCSMQPRPRPHFDIKPGMKIRIYAFMSIERGCYVAGRVLRPYKTKAQNIERMKQFTKMHFDRQHEQDQLLQEAVSTK